MKPPPFEYHGPRDLGEALETLAAVGAHGKVLAGGQSLIPMLNMRLAAPAHLVDINRLAALAVVRETPAGVTVGALARHSEVARGGAHPLLGQALRLVAHPVIRNRGTVVGSLVHADPAAELPAVLAVLDGSVRLASAGGDGVRNDGVPRDGVRNDGVPGGGGVVALPAGTAVRDVPAREFFTGPMESAARPGELAVSAHFPALGARTGTAFREVARRHGDYALAGVCAVVRLDEDLHIDAARVACIGVGPVPVVVDVSGVCERRPAVSVDWPAVAAAVRERTDPEGDVHASPAYRLHLVGVLAEQALREAAREAAA
ncbi:FAD binding domain-containing protein [Nonomuraea glycinis]|uniref:FAD binding domain-containing protein n=1 Tax=Nonomuraea glycinis TaxID=2047744 RepID=UPI002E1598B7|nr:FAD binding domain-containing protein [Nonomuraea glycinis]